MPRDWRQVLQAKGVVYEPASEPETLGTVVSGLAIEVQRWMGDSATGKPTGFCMRKSKADPLALSGKPVLRAIYDVAEELADVSREAQEAWDTVNGFLQLGRGRKAWMDYKAVRRNQRGVPPDGGCAGVDVDKSEE